MATTTGVWNSAMQSSSTAQTANPTANTTSSSSDSSNSATITANDFLTLLVTELQNQDPTASSDPNEYVNQLVSVNSLQQLISINDTLSNSLGTTSSSKSGGVQSASSATNHMVSGASSDLSSAANATSQSVRVTSGNLNVPQASTAAQRVSNAFTTPHS
jgi:flagellar basal-body rod modification protein FlgD